MKIEINNRVKSDYPATYPQSQVLLNHKNVTVTGLPPASQNARITKCMNRWDASEAISAAVSGEQVEIIFN